MRWRQRRGWGRVSGALSTLRFTLERTDGLARAGVLHTRRGDVPTPVFMPVATHAAFRHVSVDEAGEAGARILLGNTYHLMLRPGREVFERERCESSRAGIGLWARAGYYKSALVGEDDGLYAISQIQLREHVTDVGLDGGEGDEEGSRDLVVREALSDEG